MEVFKFLNKALWITVAIFAIYWIGKYIYKKLKPDRHPFFYFLSIEKKAGEWKVKVESPNDDLDLDIEVLNNNKLLVKKNARLKAGINNITLNSEELKSELTAVLKINSADQKLERKI